MRALLALSFAALLAAGLAGCVQEDPAGSDTVGPLPDAEPAPPRVVVAVIDSGVNVYHEHFQRDPVPDAVLDSFVNTLDDRAPERVRLSQEGDYDARVEADKDVWGSLERERLYQFEGTSVLGISFDESEHPVLDDGSHGTATAGAVLAANPDALVVLVEGAGSEAGEAWAAEQPWIDLLSESYGPPGSPPTWMVAGSSTAEANRVAWQSGKIPVGAADNTPAAAPVDSTAGPPWVVGVAGDDPDAGCREHDSGSLPDFTSDFTQELPEADSTDGSRPISGTSFSTPRTAGTFSAAILQVRAAWGHETGIADGALALGPDGERLTNVDVRAAFNRTAVYFDEVGTCGPVNPVAPWLQMGWGSVGPGIVNTTVDHLLGRAEAPEKPEGAQIFQGQMHDARRQAWGS